ncbi:MAG: ATP-dependent zinc metalloprotease FtsH [Candidatus Omnitrophica bacterium]|nr:ATP-dependent zinc metalloprotease FtsH [Candidatus Omnitrophota bacterium]MBU1128518.1 ATP-dependent zinc metalloprotease FtsH [Candidatus Omnitrophota bacterium]MBU1657221.1 ATP-dependent zinc metalloprotease FtsH [Candidatus Omnitrophota bacterium]MBU1784454.1 ATP-dependent zinc metalloprotease FtsH [Candidatus Omnitrophota bacterium]MBU1851353.1 ATP-dependent zinc metalloprotease FtsH [Candidatus Omnitrophota bacterium]
MWLLLIMGLFYIYQWIFSAYDQTTSQITYKEFYQTLETNDRTGRVVSAKLIDDRVLGQLNDDKRFIVNIPERDTELIKLMREQVPDFDIQPPQTFLSNIFYTLGPMVLFIGFLWFFVYRGASMGGGKMMSFGKSRAKLATKEKLKVTFDDVAGIEEAKEELKEVIEFLKSPKKFQKLGGKMPKGVLLMGPPGTGKTLLAKAVAGEAGVPFFSISGSDFVEMFVGVGASRVRDLFAQAKKTSKMSKKGSIIFMDEIDAVGRQRFSGIGGGHDEREQTLNALLSEMDGFDTGTGVILVAATNRPDVLDPALLRPGRFDRQIVVDRPDVVGREAILAVHARHVKLKKGVDLKKIAQQTAGFSGADLANLINEAALLGARRNKTAVELAELQEAMERVMAGPERRSRKISDEEKKIIAYHEAGHAIMSYLIDGADPLHKVTIISRGMALGYTMHLPQKDQYIHRRSEFVGKIAGMLGGRISEEITFHEVSTGAQNDIKRATELARDMVTQYGMSERLGHLTFGRRHSQVFLGRDITEERNYSEDTAKLIDEEVKKIVDNCYDLARTKLMENKDKLDLLANKLVEKETMDEEEVRELLGFKKA